MYKINVRQHYNIHEKFPWYHMIEIYVLDLANQICILKG